LILGLLAAALAAAQSAGAPRVALVNIQDAILATTDGQNAAKALDAEFGPRKAALDEDQKAIAQKQSRLDTEKLGDEETVVLNAKMDQADADLDKAQKKTLSELGKKMVAVIVEFATSTGYAMVFDTSTSQAPLLYAENATDITSEVIAAYETRHKSAAER
jgi:Skp family chaperone for outer membrane proteins